MRTFITTTALSVVLLLCVQVSRADPISDTISHLERMCKESSQYSIDVRGNGEFVLRDRVGKIMGLFGFGYRQASGVASGLTGQDALRYAEGVRECMSTRFLEVLSRVAPEQGPTVLLMDSVRNAYRPELRATSGSNAEDIRPILRAIQVPGVPSGLNLLRETTGSEWDGLAYVLQARPALIIIHFSSFEGPEADTPNGPVVQCTLTGAATNACNSRFFSNVATMVNSGINVVVYSRIENLCADNRNRIAFLQRLGSDLNDRSGKVYLLDMRPRGQSRTFRNPEAQRDLREVTEAALGVRPAPTQHPRYCQIR
ncbi:hypothetical protein [Falsiroseomonas sp. HW251]|uniref:hypothetical protein n=1 Tax=Falsiroseomonas sp. HW251 TaxID=3390998 RepID=UPI003D322EE6